MLYGTKNSKQTINDKAMMQKKEFLRYLEDNNFYELFIECGWNNPQGDTDLGGVEEDGIFYHFEQIAERNGFKIVKSEVITTPNTSLCKKIDHYLRRLANDYICIFYLTTPLRHLWLVPVNKTEKRDLVRVEYTTTDQASFLYEKISGFSFELGTRTGILDVREKVQKAFIVDSERVTRRFYDEFKKQHKTFTSFITGIDDFIDEENKTKPKEKRIENKNKQWYASIMLNRLMFCYFIQRKRFLDGKTDYLKRKLQEVKEQDGDDQFYSFYRSFLIHLFHDGINTPRHDSPEFLKRYGRIPYLNGGLFGEHELEQTYKDIDISDEAFEKLFDFFDQWNWHLDTSLTASGKDINPDVLGYIFEQYINDRAKMGAYYTKEDITEYIGRNTILPFIMEKVKTATQDSEKYFHTNGYVWQELSQSGDKYIFDAVKRGYTTDWKKRIPDYIAEGVDTTKPNLLKRRDRWNEKTCEEFALPTEIWRETVERFQRCEYLLEKIRNGEIVQINDFITYNLDIRQFVYDLLLNADDPRFVANFYHTLQKVTILDPTCGSGAFLFAAMNILEPLYDVCIDRMEKWHKENPIIFKTEIEEIDRKYRSNRQYYIYKSIILRNLYGVDIMVEATEIAKLRLFLKMVAVVEVDLRADNLGLDPLPDIDFNVRCGNTLVGYATEKELERDLTWGNMFANQEFREKVDEGMDKAAQAFTQFKAVQFTQEEEMIAFKKAKQELRKNLETLNDTLNHRLYSSTADATALSFLSWKESHQPFHWLAEFYEIIHNNGGFDVIIGNPPYVEYNKKVDGIAVSDLYKLKGYDTIECGNLYAYVIERVSYILNKDGKTGMIIPHSSICTDRMESLYKIFKEKKGWFSTYDTRPSKLFDGVDQRILIYILGAPNAYTTRYYHWKTEFRPFLLNQLRYTKGVFFDDYVSLSKISTQLENSIIAKMLSNRKLAYLYEKNGKYSIYYHGAPRYFTRATTFVPYFYNEKDGEKLSVSIRRVSFDNNDTAQIASCIICSSLFYYWFVATSDCRHLNSREVDNYPYSLNDDSDYISNMNYQCKQLMNDFNIKKIRKNTYYKATGQVIYDEFYPKLSKPIIDEIDKILACHYGFTEEELDFVISYDLKFRMGDELNDEQ